MITITELKVQFSDLQTCGDLQLQMWLKAAEAVTPEVQSCFDETTRNCALAAFVLHKKELDQINTRTKGGSVKSIKVDDEGSVTFQERSKDTSLSFFESLRRTSNGQVYLDLLQPLIALYTAGFASGSLRTNYPGDILSEPYNASWGLIG